MKKSDSICKYEKHLRCSRNKEWWEYRHARWENKNTKIWKMRKDKKYLVNSYNNVCRKDTEIKWIGEDRKVRKQ